MKFPWRQPVRQNLSVPRTTGILYTHWIWSLRCQQNRLSGHSFIRLGGSEKNSISSERLFLLLANLSAQALPSLYTWLVLANKALPFHQTSDSLENICVLSLPLSCLPIRFRAALDMSNPLWPRPFQPKPKAHNSARTAPVDSFDMGEWLKFLFRL